MVNKRVNPLILITTLLPLSIFIIVVSNITELLANGQFTGTGQKLGDDNTFDVGLADLKRRSFRR